MRLQRRRLPIPQYEFAFAAGTFNLMLEVSVDGDRPARERAETEQARLAAEAAQTALTKPNTNEPSIPKTSVRVLPRPSRGRRVSGRSDQNRNGSRNKVSRVSHSRSV